MPITISGSTGIAGVDGTAASPAIEGSDTNTGMFFPAADTIAFAEGGAEVLRINSSAQVEFQAGTSSLPTITTSGDLNAGIFFPAADTIAFATSGTEEFRIGPAGQFGIKGANYGTSGQVLTSAGSGASPTWSGASSLTLISALAASGTNPVASGLTLTGYKMLCIVTEGVTQNSAANRAFLIGTSTADDLTFTPTSFNATTARGIMWIDLNAGTMTSIIEQVAAGATAPAANSSATYIADLPFTTATTSISFALSGTGSFNAGTFRIYGLA
jgi:hypothetical protein